MDKLPIAILHLSDIHFQPDTNLVTNRASQIAAAVRGAVTRIAGCVVAVTGDVAFSGKQAEYQVAETFLNALSAALQKDHGCRIDLIIVPGNHDCDFSGNLEMRELAIEGLATRLDALDPAGPITRACVEVQAHFFDFHSRVSGARIAEPDRLYYEHEVVIDGDTLRFQCHNSAWVSVLHEQPGRLLYPIAVASAKDSPARPVTVAISLVHHPFNWYVPGNARSMQDLFERTSDLVMTGHEHVPAAYSRQSHTGAEVEYVEGTVLQDATREADSGFHVVILDLAARQYSYSTYQWRDAAYERTHRHDPKPFNRNPLLAQQAFDNNSTFLRYLNDPGTAFTHPRRRDLSLGDLFVYPDLSRRSWVAAEPEDLKKARAPSRDVLGFVADSANVVVTGAANAGKTSLLKTLYLDLKQRKGVVPVLLKGADMKGMRGNEVDKLCSQAFEAQYSSRHLERYRQLERSQRLVLVDDFDEARFTARGQREFVDSAKAYASCIVIMADDLFMIDLLSQTREATSEAFAGFELCTVREFGFALRGKLVDRWHALGYEIHGPDADLQHIINGAERKLNTLIGKSLVPSTPITILTLLQTMEAARTPSLASGSYGYLYEALITESMSRATNRAASVDTKYTYLSRLAYAIYDADSQALSRNELERITEEYFQEYGLRFPVGQMLEELVESRLLEEHHGQVGFKYKYIYCYFVARYLRDNVGGSAATQMRARLTYMADRIHFEDHANILIFYLYLTRDAPLIQYVLSCSRKIYAAHAPCDLDADVAFVNQLYVDTKPLLLPPGEPAEHRAGERERLDSGAEEGPERTETKDVAYNEDLADLLKINFAFKTLNVLGQVLRNYPGSLDRQVKLEIAKECYLLGLRTLKAVLNIAQGNLEELRFYFSRLIREHRPVTDVAELAQSTDEGIIWLTLGCAFGIIKRVSTAVGLQELSSTYADVQAALGQGVASRLIDVSVKLDHFDVVPMSEIEKIARDVRRNHFGRRVLRDLVANHLYLNQVDYQVKQKLGALLQIKATDVRYLANPDKKT